MRTKSIFYFLTPIVSLFILIGCGNTSSSDTQQNHGSIANEENVAMLIPRDNLQPKGEYSKASLSLNTFSKIIKEEGAGVENWIVYDKSPAGATITALNFGKEGAIQLQGDGLRNGYVLGYWTQQGAWHDQEHKSIQWSMNYSEDYYVYVRVSTAKGYRYLYYTPDDYNYGIAEHYDAPHYIHHGLGSSSIDGTWKTFSRDLEADLKEFEPDNSISTVDGFFVRGSGLIDDVMLLKAEERQTPLLSAISGWLKEHKFSSYDINRTVISGDQTRVIVHATPFYSQGDSRKLILDTSDLTHIKLLVKEWYYRMGYPIGDKIKDNDYIILVSSAWLNIYDYHTGEILSQTHLDYKWFPSAEIISLKENSLVFTSDDDIIREIDFTDRKNPIVTILFSRLASIKKWVNQQPHLSFKKFIEQFSSHQDKLRAVVSVKDDRKREDIVTYYILDISNVDNIKLLGTSLDNFFYHGSMLDSIKIRENNYIALIGSVDVTIFDYTTGELLSYTDTSCTKGVCSYLNGSTYLRIIDNYIIYSKKNDYLGNKKNFLYKLDFTDKRNPTTTLLYEGIYNSTTYSIKLSSGINSILVKDAEGNIIKEIPIN